MGRLSVQERLVDNIAQRAILRVQLNETGLNDMSNFVYFDSEGVERAYPAEINDMRMVDAAPGRNGGHTVAYQNEATYAVGVVRPGETIWVDWNYVTETGLNVMRTSDGPAYNVADMAAIMTERPSWASRRPIRGAGWEGYRYRKD